MSYFLPAMRPARCSPRVVRNDLAPLFSLLDDTFNEVGRASRYSRRPPFAPRFNVSEGKEYYSLEGELPGVDRDNVSIEFTEENTLTIKGRVEKHNRSGKQPAEEPKALEAETAADASSDTQSVRSHQPTVEDEKEWEAVDTPATSEAGPSTSTTAQSEDTSSTVAAQTEQQPQQTGPFSRPWLSERFIGDFSRSFSFSERVNQEAVTASLSNGILSIVVPKAPKPENRKISIE